MLEHQLFITKQETSVKSNFCCVHVCMVNDVFKKNKTKL